MVAWYYDSAVVGGTGAGTSWANARTTLTTMTSVVAGDQIYVAHTHAEAPGSAVTITFPGTVANPNHVICVNKAGSVPPIDTDWRTTASVATTGTFNISLAGSAYIYGITFNAGVGSAAAVLLNVNQAAGGTVGGWQYFDACMLRLSTTVAAATARVVIGQSGTNVGNRCILNNTQIYLTNALHNISAQCGHIEWRNTSNPFSGGFLPNTMFVSYGTPFTMDFVGLDFSSFSSRTFFGTATTAFRAAFYGCRISTSAAMTADPIGHPSAEVYVSGSGYLSVTPFVSQEARYGYEGSEATEPLIARAGGASDGGFPHSRAYTLNINSMNPRPYVGVPFVKWNDTALSDVTLTVYGIANRSTIPTNAIVWFEAHYFADFNIPSNRSPLMAIDHNGRKPNFFVTATNWTADTTSDWTAGTVAFRANSTAYPLGAVVKVASNPGRIFFCTTAGTTASSEPAGYATAPDGFPIIDGGTAVFRAGFRFTMTLTLTSPQPQLAGPIYVFPKLIAISTGPLYYLDPEIG